MLKEGFKERKSWKTKSNVAGCGTLESVRACYGATEDNSELG